jgi:hypothetical protein
MFTSFASFLCSCRNLEWAYVRARYERGRLSDSRHRKVEYRDIRPSAGTLIGTPRCAPRPVGLHTSRGSQLMAPRTWPDPLRGPTWTERRSGRADTNPCRLPEISSTGTQNGAWPTTRERGVAVAGPPQPRRRRQRPRSPGRRHALRGEGPGDRFRLSHRSRPSREGWARKKERQRGAAVARHAASSPVRMPAQL